MMRVSSSSPAWNRWSRPGRSLRRERSPVAPNRTTTCGCEDVADDRGRRGAHCRHRLLRSCDDGRTSRGSDGRRQTAGVGRRSSWSRSPRSTMPAYDAPWARCQREVDVLPGHLGVVGHPGPVVGVAQAEDGALVVEVAHPLDVASSHQSRGVGADEREPLVGHDQLAALTRGAAVARVLVTSALPTRRGGDQPGAGAPQRRLLRLAGRSRPAARGRPGRRPARRGQTGEVLVLGDPGRLGALVGGPVVLRTPPRGPGRDEPSVSPDAGATDAGPRAPSASSTTSRTRPPRARVRGDSGSAATSTAISCSAVRSKMSEVATCTV